IGIDRTGDSKDKKYLMRNYYPAIFLPVILPWKKLFIYNEVCYNIIDYGYSTESMMSRYDS
ncbi:MAG: hypothetical protein ACI4C5_02665, partial [Lachnospiraceae bacterium]